jgi:anti-sigma regulatory factor (Ser/Thr protein kinase)
MTDDKNPCTFRCATHLEHLADIRAFVESSCQTLAIDEHCCFQLTLAIDEACTNIIKHGHHEADLAPSQIDLSLQRAGNTVTVTIIDHGRSYDPDAIAPPDLTGDWRTRRIGGLGWHFIQKIGDYVSYQPDEVNGNKLIFQVSAQDNP